VLVIPAAVQADPARLAASLADHASAARSGYARTRFHEQLVQMVHDLGVHTVDPLPGLEAEARSGRSGFHREGHWNATGHAIAADRLEPVLGEVLAEHR
jgi:hypothetical protein